MRLARSRGYVFPDDQEFQEKAFGLGWYKYAPEVATKLLEKNGFSRMPMANGCCPMVPLGRSLIWHSPFCHDARNAVAAVQQWKKFGIDATVFGTESGADLTAVGDFDVETVWPGKEPWKRGS